MDTVDQVIVVQSDGSMIGIEREAMVDIKRLGQSSVERCSLIKWSEEQQAWYVYTLSYGPLCDMEDNTLYFDLYNDAVAYEVEYFNNVLKA